MKYKKELEKLFNYSNSLVEKFQVDKINTIIFLYAIVSSDFDNDAKKLLDEIQINLSYLIKQKIEEEYNILESNITYVGEFYPLEKDMENIMNELLIEFKNGVFKFESEINSTHILYGIIHNKNNKAYYLLSSEFNIDQTITNMFNNTPSSNLNEKQNEKETILDLLGRNLNKLAENNKLDLLVGRKEELKNIIITLGRYKKNNPILVGEAGVGKTAIVEGLAQLIVKKEINMSLIDKVIYELDLNSLIAGTKYRGQFEERMKRVIKELIDRKNIILFIDEIHTIIGAGSAEGTLDVSNILKPYLARGDIQIIGATTLNEYRKYIEKDAALSRRMQKIIIEPTSIEETIQIMKNIKNKYEDHHNVLYDDDAIEACVRLSDRYITDRLLPDKAIDVMDEAGSMLKIDTFKISKKIKEYEEQINFINKQIEIAKNKENFKECSSLKKTKDNLIKKIEEEKLKMRDKSNREVVKISHIKTIVGKISNIPIDKMDETYFEKIKKIEENLKNKVIGQDDALKRISITLRRNIAGLRNPKKPIGSFIFMGPSGVGKTYLAKKLAEEIFDSEEALIKFDMSEYGTKHEVSKLLGAPPGYVGYEEGGQLTEKIRRKPYSILLFDEIEKAHPDIYNLFLQVMDDGVLTDAFGRKINFKNTIIIFTSNIGTSFEKKNLGFGEFNNKIREEIEKEFYRTFSKEFINRLDDKIIFNNLTKDNLLQILDIYLKELEEKISPTKINIDNDVKEYLIEKSESFEFGARNLYRVVQDHLELGIADLILNNQIQNNQIKIYLKENSICFE